MKVLAVGCGEGEIAEHIGSLGVQVLCIDESEKLVDHAQNQSTTKNASYRQGSYEDLQLGKKFDLITIFRVMEKVPKSKISKFLASIVLHANASTIIYLNMTDGRYLKYSNQTDHDDDDEVIEKGYTPDVVLTLLAGHHFQPYHIGFYGEDVPIQYNEYLFATDTTFSKTCRKVTFDSEDQP